MIDIEPEVFTRLKTAIVAEYPAADVQGVYVNAPSVFPHVSIEMQDSSDVSEHISQDPTDEHDLCLFDINIYSNKEGTRKSECKAIAQIVDRVMKSMNFRRTAFTPVPNLNDATIYRFVARYRVETDGIYFYRR